MRFIHYTQHDAMDCGPTCLRMVARHYGRQWSLETLRQRCYITREGVTMLGISRAAESIGFRTLGAKLNMEQLTQQAPLPAILHWNQQHFVVLYRVTGRRGREVLHVADPAGGLVRYPRAEFERCWCSTTQEGQPAGIVLLLEPTPEFHAIEGEPQQRRSLGFLLRYLSPHRQLVVQLMLGLLLGSLLQLLLPFLSQAMVDQGIGQRNINFIYLVLIAQLVLTLSRVAVEFIRGWILLHLGTRINVSLISDFLAKLMRLPMRFFDAKMTGDLLQRIGDHSRIQSFLTGTSLNVVFSAANIIIFGVVLLFYSRSIFAVFFVGSALYALWVLLFLRRRAELDHRRFAQMSAHQSNLIQLIQGMQDIKLSGCEQQKRWEWEGIQAKLFRVSVKGLALHQYQQSGATLLNEAKNILISIMAAKAVVDGHMTLGMMTAAQYIIGQLNAPIEQLIGFFNEAQDARISLGRLSEVHLRDDEEPADSSMLHEIPADAGLRVSNLCFAYDGPDGQRVLSDVSIDIPAGKQTAIVGTSGSGKTTLVKLLLGFYPPLSGEIALGDINLSAYSLRAWRQECGVVMQDGFIFSDTIARNIAPGDERIDQQRLIEAAQAANIYDFVMQLPLGFGTKIGSEGHGLSQGQRQRVLIARAVYKNPRYIFLDEATNSLDATNERTIMQNLNQFLSGRTAVVVAHRLSTVRHADQIVVLRDGQVVEVGTHDELAQRRGEYYTLVKNQLEL
ncbi:MAG: peptidase domain-containing ABC transporter [Bacteroidales bacterium]|nr:peptidase domain-containing ABC transporter [Bacteroidales bacterium]